MGPYMCKRRKIVLVDETAYPPVIIGSNDWAAGWAVTLDDGRVIDIEGDIPRQREMALRFGVNVVMYTLSGNYKSDQVHSAALVERIGRGESQLPVEVD